MIYILGIDHIREQYPHEKNITEKVEALKETVARVCKEKDIKLIAEEWCDDARPRSSTRTTHSEDQAQNLGIEYLPCDPGQAERDRLQIKSRYQVAQESGLPFPFDENPEQERRINETEAVKQADGKREQYWLEQIIKHGSADKNILLVCGYGHVDSFVVLANGKGYEAMRV